ncbi:MAG: ABC transporter ATP-binding protein [Pseudomonadota bacterium]
MSEPVLEVQGLSTHFFTRQGEIPAVRDVSFSLQPGEVLGLVGESGSGKSVTGFSLLGLVDAPGRIVAGSVKLDGQELVGLAEPELRALRGRDISMIFQDPIATLNPMLSIGDQMRMALLAHEKRSLQEANKKCVDLLRRVGITEPEAGLRAYPHEYSGGMRQRVAIAIALLHNPSVIIADEPTTALDVSIQAQILNEMRELVRETGTALIWISHDLAVVASLADRIAVMYRGEIIETGPTFDVLRAPKQEYTANLLAALPANTEPGQLLAQGGVVRSVLNVPEMPAPPENDHFLSVSGANRVFFPSISLGEKIAGLMGAGSGRRSTHAVKNVTLRVARGETLGLVGESGSGKSTLGRLMAGILAPTSGQVLLDDAPVMQEGKKATLRIQTIFQDPFASLNPRMKVGRAVSEGALAHNLLSPSEASAYVKSWFEKVGLEPEWAERYPHQFSGGQRQRVAIARALAMQPEVLICDEPVASLDVSIQAQIINLFLELQRSLGLTMVFISHDLSVVRHVSDRVAVMYLGEIVELGPAEEIYKAPKHDYTMRLLNAVPVLDLKVD